MNIDFQIMHGVDRDDRNAQVDRLLTQLPDAVVHTDPEHRGPLSTFLKCVESALDHAQDSSSIEVDWIVVVQDDAEPYQGWLDHLEQALLFSPEPVLGLSQGGYAYREPKRAASLYQVGTYMLQGGAFAFSGSLLLDGLKEWLTPLDVVDGYFNDDAALAAFSWWTGHRTAVVTHSLVAQTLPSTLKGHVKHLKAPAYTVENLPVKAWSDPKRKLTEQANFGKGDQRLWTLLAQRWERQASIVGTVHQRGELP